MIDGEWVRETSSHPIQNQSPLWYREQDQSLVQRC